MTLKSETQVNKSYTDDELNELAEWLESITLKEAFFLKESYEKYLKLAHMRLEENLNAH